MRFSKEITIPWGYSEQIRNDFLRPFIHAKNQHRSTFFLLLGHAGKGKMHSAESVADAVFPDCDHFVLRDFSPCIQKSHPCKLRATTTISLNDAKIPARYDIHPRYCHALSLLPPKKAYQCGDTTVSDMLTFLEKTSGNAGKVVIIENIHRMTTEGMNACLKIFEDLPPNVWIFATLHDVDMILPTVVSRASLISLPAYDWILARPLVQQSFSGLNESMYDTLAQKNQQTYGTLTRLLWECVHTPESGIRQTRTQVHTYWTQKDFFSLSKLCCELSLTDMQLCIGFWLQDKDTASIAHARTRFNQRIEANVPYEHSMIAFCMDVIAGK